MSKSNKIVGFLSVLMVLYLLEVLLIFNVSVVNVVRFILLNVISIFLPGIALLSVTKIELTRTGHFCMAYILGYAFLVPQ